MPFTTITSDGIDIVCFLVEHDWEARFTVAHYFPVDVTIGLSERESRRPEAEGMLLSVDVEIFAEDAEAQALRQILATLGKSWIGVPILADQFDGADAATAGARIYSPQRLIDLTAVAIVDNASTLTAGHTYAPLLVGHITELPEIDPQGAYATCSALITEDSPWTFRIGIAGSHTAGTWPAALIPEWTAPPVETPVKSLSFERIGFQREQTIAQEERAFHWTSEAGFGCIDKTEIATLLGFFAVSRGPWRAFDAPMWWTPGEPTAEAPHATKVRFADPTLTLDFTSSHIADAKIKFAQVPWEITGTEGETPEQPARIFLYRFRYDLPTPIFFRFTNCWRPLVRTSDGTYAPGPFLHDEISESADLSDNGTTVASFIFSGNPLTMFNPLTLEGRLWLDIFEVETEPIDPDAATLRWSGSVKRAPQTGRSIKAECVWLAGVMDREIPGVRIGPNCNTRMYSTRCGLIKATFAKAGTLLSASDNTLVVTTSDSAAEHTYAPGWIEIGTGATWELRSIVGSTPVTGGQQLIVDSPIRQIATGQNVTYYRGCDGTAATCKALGNFANFRGHPNLPRVNLSIPSYNTPVSGKK